MDLNKEQLESIMESAREHFDGEIPDELMEEFVVLRCSV